MRVVYTLHEHAARQLPDIGMVVPNRVTMTSSVLCMFEFFKRNVMTMLFEKIDYSPADDPVNEAKDYASLTNAVGNYMKMIRHEYISEDQKTARGACFIQCLARNLLKVCLTEYRQTISCY